MTPLPTSDPFALFADALSRAKAAGPFDATAAALATADGHGRPSVRIVLLKGVDARGFTFYTNRESRKALQMAENPFASLCFFWPAIEEQVRVEGPIERVSDAESDTYFASRARGSQLGAWASKQSAPLASREDLEARVREVSAQFPDEVPRPPFWGGYRLLPERIEFWRGRPDRLHDRWVYTRSDAGWAFERLSP